jgi:PAS domain-containing protein
VVLYSGNYAPTELRPVADAYQVAAVIAKTSDPQPLLDAVEAAIRSGQRQPAAAADLPAPTEASLRHLQLVNDKLVRTLGELHSSEERFGAVVESAPVGVVIGSTAGEAEYANPWAAEILALSPGQLLGAGWLDRLGAEVRTLLRTTLPGRRTGVRPPPAADQAGAAGRTGTVVGHHDVPDDRRRGTAQRLRRHPRRRHRRDRR